MMNGKIPDPTPAGGAIVAGILFVTLVIVGAYDLWAMVGGLHASTASYWVKAWSAQWPFLPFLCGILAGHLFF